MKNYKETRKRLLCLSTASVTMKHNYQMVFMFVLYKQDGNNTFICLKKLYITTKDRKDFLNLQIFCHFFPPILRVFIYFLIWWVTKVKSPLSLVPSKHIPSQATNDTTLVFCHSLVNECTLMYTCKKMCYIQNQDHLMLLPCNSLYALKILPMLSSRIIISTICLWSFWNTSSYNLRFS